MGQQKIPAAIVGPGNIGTDLLAKLAHSPVIDVRYIDGSLCALGAGAGNSPTEVLGAVFDRLGVATGLDAGLLLDAAEEVVRPYLSQWPKMDRNAIVQGWAGVYSSFLLHAERAAERYKVPAHAILRRCGERGYVGGQEDMIIDIAIGLAEEQTT
ncbi:hypothetical protein ACWELB_22440 [Streptomyces asiaticus]